MIVVPMEPWHLEVLTLQPAQASMGVWTGNAGYCSELAKFEGYAGLDGDEVLGCIGILPQWEGRSIAWALLGNVGPRRFVAVHKAVERWINERSPRRLETWVAVGHSAGERWAEMLGFSVEGLMKAFMPDGSNAWLCARVRR